VKFPFLQKKEGTEGGGAFSLKRKKGREEKGTIFLFHRGKKEEKNYANSLSSPFEERRKREGGSRGANLFPSEREGACFSFFLPPTAQRGFKTPSCA